jgi:hypothetical protein
MKKQTFLFQACLMVCLLAACSSPTPIAVPETPLTDTISKPIPLEQISASEMLTTIADLAQIEAFSGWRNSASSGEAQALDYMENRLADLQTLKQFGMETERQVFPVLMGTELHETNLILEVRGKQVEVPADGLRGHRDDPRLALRFDSDGSLVDNQPNPVKAQGGVLLVTSEKDLDALPASGAQGKIIIVPYAVIDRSRLGVRGATAISAKILDKNPAGVVIVTQYSSRPGESNGAFVGDGSGFTYAESPHKPPILYTRVEDLAASGIRGMADLDKIEAAQMVWDADVVSPAVSGNLIARIPGENSEQAIILGAHIDSPNAPGAMDDGSGSAILLEVARVLDHAGQKPPVDLYLVWFGSEELGLYGSAHFTATHQDLLDRTIAMLQIDNLTRPLDGVPADLYLVGWSAGRFGKPQLPWMDALKAISGEAGILIKTLDEYSIYSDNSSFGGYNVPNQDLIYMSPEMESLGGVWVAGSIHSPYDTLERAQEGQDVLVQMGKVSLLAALAPGQNPSNFRLTNSIQGRAVFVASHTQAAHMTPGTFLEMGMAFSMAGLDVDLIPYGQPVTKQDLNDAKIVVVLPTVDYAFSNPDELPNETFLPQELRVLEEYVHAGGLLLLTNSSHQLKYGNSVMAANEDSQAINDLASRFGVTYLNQTHHSASVAVQVDHPLLDQVAALQMAENNGLLFEMENGQVLAASNAGAALGLVSLENGGEVLVLADVALLNNTWGSTTNLPFWKSLASYSLER